MRDIPAFWRKRGWLAWLLLPFSVLFALLSSVRRRMLRAQAQALPVPVVVVGNLSVGGNGKTPVVLALVDALQARGWRVGVISGGYGGQVYRTDAVCEVSAQSTAEAVGDEPLLIARQTGVPVVVGRDRVAAADFLLARYAQVNVLISDDGLQHYRLPRAVEWVVVAADFGLGNGFVLPAGPLREGRRRLKAAQALLITATGSAADTVHCRKVPRYRLPVMSEGARLLAGGEWLDWAALVGQPCYLLTAIARGERVYAALADMLNIVDARYLPDHARIAAQEAQFAGSQGWIVVTAKDAVKLDDWPPALRARVLVVDYRLQLPALLLDVLEEQLQAFSLAQKRPPSARAARRSR